MYYAVKSKLCWCPTISVCGWARHHGPVCVNFLFFLCVFWLQIAIKCFVSSLKFVLIVFCVLASDRHQVFCKLTEAQSVHGELL